MNSTPYHLIFVIDVDTRVIWMGPAGSAKQTIWLMTEIYFIVNNSKDFPNTLKGGGWSDYRTWKFSQITIKVEISGKLSPLLADPDSLK